MLYMPKPLHKSLLLLFATVVFARCAQVVPLSGGQRDKIPPKLEEAQPANKSTNFIGEEIVLKFDEFVKLNNLQEQLVITPRMAEMPDVTTEGKKIRIRLKNNLVAPNTTYRFYFGNAIADMHEGNVLKDFEYIFSTGGFIDSLKSKGRITDAFNNQPVPDVLVGLYANQNFTDSLPYKAMPDYFGKTNANGDFIVQNLPPLTYKLYAFTDKNKNYLYDGDAEKIAFLPTELVLGSDTTTNLKLFQEEAPKTYIRKTLTPYHGFAQILLNKRCHVLLSAQNPKSGVRIFETNKGSEKDTVAFYYRNAPDTLGILIKNDCNNKTDTVQLALPRLVKKRKQKITATNLAQGKLELNQPLRLYFPVWMDTALTNQSALKLLSKQNNSFTAIPAKGYWVNATTFELSTALSNGSEYQLKTDTTAFVDVNGNPADSARFSFKAAEPSDYGKLGVKLKVLRKQNYLVQLLGAQEQVVRQLAVDFPLSSSNITTLSFANLQPGEYTVKVVFDNNQNGKWDTGAVLRKLLPEPVFVSEKKIKVRADWEIEEEIALKEIPAY